MSGVGNALLGARRAERTRAVQWLGRFGDVCYGVVHVVIAVLAVRTAVVGSGGEMDQQGAIAAVAAQPWGVAVLWLVAIGLVAFGVWQILAAAVSFQWVSGEGRRTRKRLGALARAIAVLAIAAFTIKLLLSAPAASGNQNKQQMTARLLAAPGGRVLVAAIGVGIVVGALVIGYRGVKRSFTQDWDRRSRTGKAGRWAVRVGAVGFVAKAVAYAIVGALFVTAAVTIDPNRAGGLDAALRTLAGPPYGVVLLVVVALGLACYGGYCFADARYRRV